MKDDIKWVEVESSNIQAMAHDGEFLYIRFNSGDTYRYKNVPISLFETIRDAESVGKAFHATLRQNPELYPYEKLSLSSA